MLFVIPPLIPSPRSQPMRTISTSSAGSLEQPNIRCRDISFCVRVAGLPRLGFKYVSAREESAIVFAG
jgi:hypothetical protein